MCCQQPQLGNGSVLGSLFFLQLNLVPVKEIPPAKGLHLSQPLGYILMASGSSHWECHFWLTLGICLHACVERTILLANPYLKYRVQPLEFFKSNLLFNVANEQKKAGVKERSHPQCY